MTSHSSSILVFLDLPQFLHQSHPAAFLRFPALSPLASSKSLRRAAGKLLSIDPVLSISRAAARSSPAEGGADGGALVDEGKKEEELIRADKSAFPPDGAGNGGSLLRRQKQQRNAASGDSVSLGIREPVYEVIYLLNSLFNMFEQACEFLILFLFFFFSVFFISLDNSIPFTFSIYA